MQGFLGLLVQGQGGGDHTRGYEAVLRNQRKPPRTKTLSWLHKDESNNQPLDLLPGSAAILGPGTAPHLRDSLLPLQRAHSHKAGGRCSCLLLPLIADEPQVGTKSPNARSARWECYSEPVSRRRTGWHEPTLLMTAASEPAADWLPPLTPSLLLRKEAAPFPVWCSCFGPT